MFWSGDRSRSGAVGLLLCSRRRRGKLFRVWTRLGARTVWGPDGYPLVRSSQAQSMYRWAKASRLKPTRGPEDRDGASFATEMRVRFPAGCSRGERDGREAELSMAPTPPNSLAAPSQESGTTLGRCFLLLLLILPCAPFSFSRVEWRRSKRTAHEKQSVVGPFDFW